MTVSVVTKRFVNTPSVLELYKEEHPGEDLGVDQDQVDACEQDRRRVAQHGVGGIDVEVEMPGA